jgi:Kef-type K+ transport system membrane component KefB
MLGSAGVPLPPLDDHSLLVFWCQILLVLVAARSAGYAARRLGQPRVVGELLAGVALGPSLFGALWPDGFDWLFPPSERQAGLLLGLAWIGIVLLLGVSGAEVDQRVIRRSGRAALTTSVGSLVVPLAFGAVVASLVPSGFIGPDGTRTVFVAFFAVAFAISSLPVAARVLGDLGLTDRPFAQLSLGVATANDIAGWLLLGVVVSVVDVGNFSPRPLVVALGAVAVVCGLALRFGSRLLDSALDAVRERDGGPAAEASIVMLAVIGVGTITHAVGIEAVIGAFIAGIAIGESRLRRSDGFEAIETVTNAVFAPLFFAVAGLRVDLSELASWSVFGWTVAVTVAAIVAKVAGAYIGGRIGRLAHRDALSVGVTLNARGALEIVVATVGLTLGIIESTTYTIIVVMALVTTAICGPLLKRTILPAPA